MIFVSIISLIIALLHFHSFRSVAPSTWILDLPDVSSHNFCLYSLGYICERPLAVSLFRLSTVLVYFNDRVLISKYAFLFSILIILFEKVLFLLFGCNGFSSLSKFIRGGGFFSFFLFLTLSVFSSLPISVFIHNAVGLPNIVVCLIAWLVKEKVADCCGFLLLL